MRWSSLCPPSTHVRVSGLFLEGNRSYGRVLSKGRTHLDLLFSNTLLVSRGHFAGHSLPSDLATGDLQSQFHP